MGKHIKKNIFEKIFSFVSFGSDVEVQCNKGNEGAPKSSKKDKHSCNVALYANINQNTFLVA